MEGLENKLEVTSKNVNNEEQVREILSRMPATIAKLANEVNNAQVDLDEAEQNLKVVKAKSHLYATAHKDELGLSSVEDRKAWVTQQEDVQEAENRIILASSALRIAQIKCNRGEQEFITVRKLASLIEKEKDAQKNYDKYSNDQY